MCRLCLESKPLCRSHIIPDFFWSALELMAVTGNDPSPRAHIHALSSPSSTAWKKGLLRKEEVMKMVSVRERLLCRDCEGKLSVWEKYGREFFYGNAPGPIRKPPMAKWGPQMETAVGYGRHTADYTPFRLFLLSILWKVSIARGKFYQAVDLGPHHEEALRRLLNAGNPGEWSAYPCNIADIRRVVKDNPYLEGVEEWVELPDTIASGSIPVIRMGMGGFRFVFYVTDIPLPKHLVYGSIRPTGDLVVAVFDFDSVIEPLVESLLPKPIIIHTPWRIGESPYDKRP